MKIEKYFWDLNERALKETRRVLQSPQHPQFYERLFRLLSRCDDIKELFSLLSKKQFIASWPRIRKYWLKIGQSLDFLNWWETVYEQLLGKKPSLGKTRENLQFIGNVIKKSRVQKEWSQGDLALRVGMRQPDICAIELGKKNMTILTLLKICRVLEIESIPLK